MLDVQGVTRMFGQKAAFDIHVAVDEATRPAYVEVLADERGNTTTGFQLRTLRWFGRN